MQVRMNTLTNIYKNPYKNRINKNQNKVQYYSNVKTDNLKTDSLTKNVNFGVNLFGNKYDRLINSYYKQVASNHPIPPKSLDKLKKLTKLLITTDNFEKQRLLKNKELRQTFSNYVNEDNYLANAEFTEIMNGATTDLYKLKLNDYFNSNKLITNDNKTTSKLLRGTTGIMLQYLNSLINTDKKEHTPQYCSDKIDSLTEHVIANSEEIYYIEPFTNNEENSLRQISEGLKKVPPEKLLNWYESAFNYHMNLNGLLVGSSNKSDFFKATVNHNIVFNSDNIPLPEYMQDTTEQKIVNYLNRNSSEIELRKDNIIDDSIRIAEFSSKTLEKGYYESSLKTRMLICEQLLNYPKIYEDINGIKPAENQKDSLKAETVFTNNILGKYISELIEHKDASLLTEEQRKDSLQKIYQKIPEGTLRQYRLNAQNKKTINAMITACSKMQPEILIDNYSSYFSLMLSEYFDY